MQKQANAQQISITLAFLVIGVLIAAKHGSWLSSAISWLSAPAQRQKA